MNDDWQPVYPLDNEDPERTPQRSVDMVALVAGVVFSLLAVVLMIGLDVPVGLFAGGGILWLVLVGAGVALLVSELRRAGRRSVDRR